MWEAEIDLHAGVSGHGFQRGFYYIGMNYDRPGFPWAGLGIGCRFPDPVRENKCTDHRLGESRAKVHLVGSLGNFNVLGRYACDLGDGG